MSDTGPPTNPGDVVVRGQRRANSFESFPTCAPVTADLDPDTDTREEIPSDIDPCANPETALIWNADAAAAAAVAALFAKAASLNDGSTLSNREFGLNLIRGSGTQVGLQPNVSVGLVPPSGTIPGVDLDMTGVTRANWMGDIHNHPSGDGRLSDDE